MHLQPMALALCVLLAACSTTPPPENRERDKDADAREEAYQQCLRDNMAASVAWEVIEAQCRREVDGEDDPLAARP